MEDHRVDLVCPEDMGESQEQSDWDSCPLGLCDMDKKYISRFFDFFFSISILITILTQTDMLYLHLTCLAHLVLHFSLFYYTFYSISFFLPIYIYIYIYMLLCGVTFI